jgi:ATP-binding cassette subfamily B protein
MPLMDQVLIPYQKGVPIEPETVGLYLIGLFGAALVAWILGWARTYTLALVSERMGADLRTQTYEHLLGLSLQYFGGKRTGDLMSRIGAETDRIWGLRQGARCYLTKPIDAEELLSKIADLVH